MLYSASALQRVPGEDADVPAALRFITAVHQYGWPDLFASQAAPLVQATGRILARRGARFDFDGGQFAALFNEQVYFMAGAVAPEAQVGRPCGIEALFQVVGYDPGFKKGTTQWMTAQLRR